MRKIYLALLAVLFLSAAKSQSTTLVISQVYGGGQSAGATYNADYVELHNISNASVSLNGKSVQYGAAGTTTWTSNFSLPNVSVPAGGYYLIRMSATGAGTALPTPDAVSGSISMSATGGKVALVNGTTTISGCAAASIIDMVGYGSTGCFEGAATAPGLTTTTAGFRALNGCQDTDQNGTDFSTAAPSPRNSASAVNLCSVSCTTPSQKPTDIRYGGSPTPTSMTVYFTRGNGTGSLVICRQGAAVNMTPVNGTTYTASTTFGSGSDLGGGNYAVFNTGFRSVNAFTVTGLTAGTKYYFSVFEYNDPNKCYTATGLVDSFIVGGTLLKPGDLVFVGWDNQIVSGGEDKLYLSNMVDITKGTQFSITNSRFEAGAAANTRTNRWYGGSSDPYQDPDKQDFEYVGSGIAKGSVISMESNATSGFTNFTINGVAVPASDFSAKTGTSNFISNTGTDADQLYITQGRFTPYGTAGVDRYNLFNGLVIHGITIRTPWIAFTSAVSAGTGGGSTRQSRIPPDILCINTSFPSSSLGYGVYNRAMGTTGSKNQLISSFNNNGNWFSGAGTTTADDALGSEANVNNTYTVNSSNADGYWTGGSSDWFDCNNWQGLHVPDSTTTVVRTGTVPNEPVINVASSSNAPLYSNTARAHTININTGSLSLTGTGNDKLEVEFFLNIISGSLLQFENNSNAAGDTILVHGAFNDQNFGGTNFIPGQGTVVMAETREATTYNWIKYSGPFNFYKLAIDNSRSNILTNEFYVQNNLNLQYGYIQASPASTLTLAAAATVTSPTNVYGQANKGWQYSFVNGKMYYEADASTVSRVFPIGYIGTDTLFAPVEVEKTNTTACTYDARYFPVAYSDLAVDVAQLHHVSKVEHWLINSTVPSAQAKITLSWRPRSKVGDGTTSLAPLDSLMVSHYFDDDGAGTNPYLWHVDGGSNIIMPKNPGYNTSYGLITTVAATGSFSPFTLGTRGNYNILPVKLLSFNGSLNNGRVYLQWITTEEQFVDRYEVEKSTDGSHFYHSGTVISLNMASRYTYNSVDINPVNGWNYYRLKVIDKNGKSSYSLIIRVWSGSETDGKLLIYPNPTREELKINLPAPSSISIIQVVNMSGQVVKQLTTTDQSLTINVRSLSNGLYILKVITDRQTITQGFTKQ